MDFLYNKIIETITENQSRFIEKGLTPPATIDLYAGQPIAPEMYSFSTPALLMEYNIDWESGNAYVKRGKFAMYIHVLVDPLPGMDNFGTQPTAGQQKIEYYDLIAHLLEGLSSESTGTISLVKEVSHTVDFHNYQILEFTGMIYKNERHSLSKYPVPPQITLNEIK